MTFNNVLVITDNPKMFSVFRTLIEKLEIKQNITYKRSRGSKKLFLDYENVISPINLKKKYENVIKNFDLCFSIHCKQIFPKEMVETITCINVHPGLNPYNRGWYPQVFSIINGLPLGATIHEMDEFLDHGPIIDQEEVVLFETDTSFTAYNRVLDAEERLLEKNLKDIFKNTYTASLPKKEGNVNTIKDFSRLCEIDLNEETTFKEFYNKMRALTHGNYKNAYFINEDGDKVFLSLSFDGKNIND